MLLVLILIFCEKKVNIFYNNFRYTCGDYILLCAFYGNYYVYLCVFILMKKVNGVNVFVFTPMILFMVKNVKIGFLFGVNVCLFIVTVLFYV